jgi:uncharacterized membrane protein YdbT with pleckstrin-like domain
MDDNVKNQVIDKQGYQTFGKKVFWLFFLQISPTALVFLLISVVLFILSFQPFLTNSPFGNIQKYTFAASLITLMLCLLIIAGCLAFAWLTYINYVFSMGEDSFRIKRGIFNKTENAIPYRQIQNVDIERDITFQMLGLSRLIILTAGHEDESSKGDEAEGVIPAIDQKLAEWLQTELLKRADIQKTLQVNK